MSFHDPEGYIDSTDYPPLPLHSYLECTYNVTVYTGYGVELQVRSASVGGDHHGLDPLRRGSKGCKTPTASGTAAPGLLKKYPARGKKKLGFS